VVASVAGVLVDSTGIPLVAGASAFVVDGGLNPTPTDDKGRFSVPTGKTSPQLAFQYGGFQVISKPLAGGAADIGTVTMPPMDSATIRVVDSKGSPVAGASVTVSTTDPVLTAPSWRDAGFALNEVVDVDRVYWSPYVISNYAGEVHLKIPRLDGGLPALKVQYTDPATGAELKTSTVDGADPTKPITAVFSTLTIPILVAPIAVTFADKDGTKDDSYTVPATTGVDYFVADRVVPAGTYPGTGAVTVTAKAKTDYVLAPGVTASWATTFSTQPAVYIPPAVSPFMDVSAGQQFYKEMAWLADQKISTGWTETDGSRTYRPLTSINRDAMAAFLYRIAGNTA
jgi:hypothetical protein